MFRNKNKLFIVAAISFVALSALLGSCKKKNETPKAVEFVQYNTFSNYSHIYRDVFEWAFENGKWSEQRYKESKIVYVSFTGTMKEGVLDGNGGVSFGFNFKVNEVINTIDIDGGTIDDKDSSVGGQLSFNDAYAIIKKIFASYDAWRKAFYG